MTPIFETPRLWGREYAEDDAEAAFEIYGDPEVMEFIGPTNVPTRVAKRRDTIAAFRAKYTAFGAPFGAFALVERATAELVGSGLLKPLPDASGKSTEDIEIG